MKFSITFLCLASLLGATGVAARNAASPSVTTVSTRKNTKPAFVAKRSSSSSSSAATFVAESIPRGGAGCSDTNAALFAKIGTTTILEAAALYGIILGSTKVSDKIPVKVLGEPLLELLASAFCIFGAATVGAVIQGGVGAATKQVLNPSEIPGDPNWYAKLNKPWWNPPAWAFPVMWVIVSKPTQLSAMSRMLKFGGIKEGSKGSLVALAIYTAHLALGSAWNKVFFGLECIGRGTVLISLMYAALLTSTYLFYQIDPGAGYYMLPTCGWLSVATALQYYIYFNNKK